MNRYNIKWLLIAAAITILLYTISELAGFEIAVFAGIAAIMISISRITKLLVLVPDRELQFKVTGSGEIEDKEAWYIVRSEIKRTINRQIRWNEMKKLISGKHEREPNQSEHARS